MIAALFVEKDGAYYGVEGVDPWDEERDARLYAGPYPVIAHPPCERWGRYWYGQAGTPVGDPRRKKLGDDNGCFAAAVTAVRRFGGVLEHPEATHAWKAHGISAPPKAGGWVPAGDGFGVTCCVEQGHYGHKARKATWLYAVGFNPPELKWGPKRGLIRMEAGYHSAAERRAALGARKAARNPNTIEWLPRKERAATPAPFKELLIRMVRESGLIERNRVIYG